MRFLPSFALWRDQQINFVSFFGLLAAPGVSWGPPGGLLGSSCGFGWDLLGPSSGFRSGSWSVLGRSRDLLGFMSRSCQELPAPSSYIVPKVFKIP